MMAVFGALVKYLVLFVFFIAVSGMGIFCGKSLKTKKAAAAKNEEN